MNKILLIEDDLNKIKQLQVFLDNNQNGFLKFELTVKKSYQSGLESVLQGDYDLVLLDMSMHNFDKSVNETGGEFMQFAGENILKEMVWNEIFFPVIIVTQYDLIGNKSLDVLRQEWKNDYKKIYLGCVFYSANELNWKNELLALIKIKLK